MFQYYEMSYGLNVEMHKQVGQNMIDITVDVLWQKIYLGQLQR